MGILLSICFGSYLFIAPYADHGWPILTMFAVVNFVGGSYLPAGLEYLVELTYPVGESTSGGILNMAIMLLSIPLTTTCNLFLNDGTKEGANKSFMFLAALCCFGTLILSFTKEKLNR